MKHLKGYTDESEFPKVFFIFMEILFETGKISSFIIAHYKLQGF